MRFHVQRLSDSGVWMFINAFDLLDDATVFARASWGACRVFDSENDRVVWGNF